MCTKLPNFILIGAHKSGTTSLYQYLKEHPHIYMSPIKEPGYFFSKINDPNDYERPAITSIQDYKKLFSEVSSETAIGEATTAYLLIEESAYHIQSELENPKIIAILRNPVDRVYSHFLMNVRNGVEYNRSVIDAIAQDNKRIKQRLKPFFYYINFGLYYKNLCIYFKIFKNENIKIFLYEDLLNNPNQVLSDFYKFIGVENILPSNIDVKFNISQIPKSKILFFILNIISNNKYLFLFIKEGSLSKNLLYLLKSLKRYNLKSPDPLLKEERSFIKAFYSEDVKKLEFLIERDLKSWL